MILERFGIWVVEQVPQGLGLRRDVEKLRRGAFTGVLVAGALACAAGFFGAPLPFVIMAGVFCGFVLVRALRMPRSEPVIGLSRDAIGVLSASEGFVRRAAPKGVRVSRVQPDRADHMRRTALPVWRVCVDTDGENFAFDVARESDAERLADFLVSQLGVERSSRAV